jgi:hypothetical protein
VDEHRGFGFPLAANEWRVTNEYRISQFGKKALPNSTPGIVKMRPGNSSDGWWGYDALTLLAATATRTTKTAQCHNADGGWHCKDGHTLPPHPAAHLGCDRVRLQGGKHTALEEEPMAVINSVDSSSAPTLSRALQTWTAMGRRYTCTRRERLRKSPPYRWPRLLLAAAESRSADPGIAIDTPGFDAGTGPRPPSALALSCWPTLAHVPRARC